MSNIKKPVKMSCQNVSTKKNINVKVSLVTTCKGRLSYLKDSLKTWLEIDYSNFDIIIVDYDCPDGTEDYIKKNIGIFLKNSKVLDIHIIKVKNKPVFNLCDARNTGIDFADSELILMIDADVHIKSKNILNYISEQYNKGIVFISNVAVLNTQDQEGLVFYKLKYGIQKFPVYSFLPTQCDRVGLTGTVCFQKKLFLNSGKYRSRVFNLGRGENDIDFYIRYLNYILYRNKNSEEKFILSVSNNIKNTMKKIDNFADNTFKLIDNTIEEKSRFYKTNNVGNQISKTIIRDLIENKGINYGWIRKKADKKEKINSVFKYNRYIKRLIPIWFKPWYHYWCGINYFKRGEVIESENSFKNVINDRNAKLNYICQAYFFIARIKKDKNNKNWKFYLNKGDKIIEENKIFKLAENHYDIYHLASFFKFFNFPYKAIKLFNYLITKTDHSILVSGAYFHLGEIAYREKKLKKAKKMFRKALLIEPKHQQAREYLLGLGAII